MHPTRLDQIARAFAADHNRRDALRLFASGLVAGVSALRGGPAADASRRDERNPSEGLPIPPRRPVNPPGLDPCSKVLCEVGTACVEGQCLPIEGYCGGKVCPAGMTCICLDNSPVGSFDPDELCRCECPNDQVLVEGTCLCPPGTGCSGIASAGRIFGPDDLLDREYTTAGTCCAYPQTARACSNSGPGMTDGFAVCCIDGVDCPEPLPGQVCATGGQTECCDMSCWGGDAAAGNPGY